MSPHDTHPNGMHGTKVTQRQLAQSWPLHSPAGGDAISTSEAMHEYFRQGPLAGFRSGRPRCVNTHISTFNRLSREGTRGPPHGRDAWRGEHKRGVSQPHRSSSTRCPSTGAPSGSPAGRRRPSSAGAEAPPTAVAVAAAAFIQSGARVPWDKCRTELRTERARSDHTGWTTPVNQRCPAAITVTECARRIGAPNPPESGLLPSARPTQSLLKFPSPGTL